MNILIIANNDEVLAKWDRLIEVAHHPLAKFNDENKVGLTESIQVIEELSRSSGRSNVYSCIGRYVGPGLRHHSGPEVMLDFANDLDMLPLNAFYVFSEIYLLPSENTDYWRVLKNDGRTVSFISYFDLKKDDMGPLTSISKMIDEKVAEPIEKADLRTRLSTRATAIKAGSVSARTSMSETSVREALAELATLMQRFNPTKDELFVARTYNGVGWKNATLVQVFLETKRFGHAVEEGDVELEFAIRNIFDVMGVEMVGKIVEGIGGNYWRESSISVDVVGGRPRLFIQHEGVTVCIEPKV